MVNGTSNVDALIICLNSPICSVVKNVGKSMQSYRKCKYKPDIMVKYVEIDP